ncbi:MAG: xanthine dehydrogenase accessory factor, partial [Rhodothermales bacterium]
SWLYTEPLLNPRRLLVLGGGHCALALSKVAREAGFHVTVADDRANLATLRDNYAAHQCLSLRDLSEAAGQIAFPELTSVVAMGTDIESDLKSLSGVLRRPFPFIGLMGAPAKISRIRQALTDSGLGPEALSRITAPVGLPIGSRTPQEIAISVTAQLIQRDRLTQPAV